MRGDAILVVDDHAANRRFLQILLGNAGYDVRVAKDAGEALSSIGVSRPRLILMDIRLPGMDGLELTRQIKADPATPDVVVVAMTAHASKEDERASLAAGCAGHIAKPCPALVLLQRIEEYLARP